MISVIQNVTIYFTICNNFMGANLIKTNGRLCAFSTHFMCQHVAFNVCK